MDVAVKKSNKENTKPAAGLKKTEARNVVSKQSLKKTVPLQSKNDLKAERKEGDVQERAATKEQVKLVPKPNASAPDKRKTLSQAFRTEQSVRHRKLVQEVQKPPQSVPPKPAPGTYKGRVVQSKIDCFRKPTSGEEKPADPASVAKFAKPSIPRPKKEVGTLSKFRSKSVTTLPSSSRPRLQPNLPSRTKSVSDAQLNVAEKPVQRSVSQKRIPPRAPASVRPTTVPPRAPASARPTAVPPRAPASAACPAATKVTSFIRRKEPPVQNTKPKPAAAAVEQKVQKSASSTISQYRVRAETAEERRAKLAEWLASKGKTLKRPVLSEKAAPVRKMAAPPKAMQEPREKSQPGPKSQPEEKQPGEVTTHDQAQGHQVPPSKPVFSSSPTHIMNTTLDLLDNSDMDLPVDPEIKMESLVLNLCERLDAMEPPSSCDNGTKTDEGEEAEVLSNGRVEEETDKEFEILEEEELEVKEKEELEVQEESLHDDTTDRNELKSESEEELKSESEEDLKSESEEDLKSESEEDLKSESDGDVYEQKEKKPLKDVVTEDESEGDDDEKMDTTPVEVTEASVVKYNVKTTPFLQSVKKRIETEGQTAGSSSRRKNAIKDLKFLTPVRRSSRLHRKSSRLPDMLSDHDPCVSSLAELVQLEDADSSAYIYRRNPALLDELPDQPGDLDRLSGGSK